MSEKTMHAAVLHAVGDLRYEEVARPEPRSGEVLLKVLGCGICGSDIPRVFVSGTYHFPTIPGHEFAGKIVYDPDGELDGKYAAVFPLIPCRKCAACEVGEYANCSDYDYYGSRRDGGFAEYIAVDKRNLILLPENVDPVVASLCEPGAVGRAAVRRLDVQLGDLCVIFGAGPIGLIAAQWARRAGASKVRVVDISDEKLAFAEKFGFEAYDQARDGLADCVLEGTGASPALANCVLSLKNHGRLVLMGNPGRDMTLPQKVYSQILRRELSIFGTWNSSFNSVTNDWTATVAAMADGSINYADLITHRVALFDCNRALTMMRDKTEFFTKVTFVNPE